MPKFKHYDYNQSSMVVINYEEQLQPGTFEHAIHYLIDNKLDLSVYYPNYHNDDNGRPAYDPAILLKIILFAYSKGITSSRQIQWSCETNIIFKALSCDSVPHFTTIANFVSSHSNEIEEIFEQILLVCHEQGLLGNELFAIDGCKMSSNASKEWSGTLKELAQKRDKIQRQIRHHIKEHQRIDKSESSEQERAQRLKQTIETLNSASDKIDKFLKTAAPRMGKGRSLKEVKSNITDNESAKMTTSKGTIQGYNGVAAVDKKHQVIIEAQAFGEGQEHHTLQPVAQLIKQRFQRLGISNDIYTTGTVLTADTGFANEANMRYLHDQEINAYVPDNQFRSRDPKFADQKTKYGKRHQHEKRQPQGFPPDQFQLDQTSKTCVCPAGESMWLHSERVDSNGNLKLFFEGRLSKCRNCTLKTQCMRNPESADTRKGHGRQVSFILKKGDSNKDSKLNYTDWMKIRVDSPKGKQVYSHRMSVVEPVFGNIGVNKGLNRFSLRSRKKVQGQWQMYCMIHNIEKLMNYGRLAA
jgi:transposase